MAIDMNDFIFHSSHLPYGSAPPIEVSVPLSGTVPANGSLVIAGDAVDTGDPGSEARLYVKKPTQWTHSNVPDNAWMLGSANLYKAFESGGQQPLGIHLVISVRTLNGKVEPVFAMYNNTGTPRAVPTGSVDIKIVPYIRP